MGLPKPDKEYYGMLKACASNGQRGFDIVGAMDNQNLTSVGSKVSNINHGVGTRFNSMGFIEAPTNKTNPSLVIPTLNNPKTKPTYHKFVGSSMNRESGIIRKYGKWKLRDEDCKMGLGRDVGLEGIVGLSLKALVGNFSYMEMNVEDIPQ